MIYRNEIRFFENMVFFKHRIKTDIDSSDYAQHLNALECTKWKGIVVKIRFSWWSLGHIKGKINLDKLPWISFRMSYMNFNRIPSPVQESIESSLQIVHDISTENIGTLCISKQYSPLKIPLNTERYDGARQKSDLASVILQDLGFNKHSGEYLWAKIVVLLWQGSNKNISMDRTWLWAWKNVVEVGIDFFFL